MGYMKKLKIVLADTDEKYIEPLISKFVDELGENIELEVISSEEYFQSYFSVPQDVDMLVVNQKMYCEELQKQNIKHICILTEEIEKSKKENSVVHMIYKYSNMKELFSEIMYQVGKELNALNQRSFHTKVITVCSGIGGVGKTSIALSLSEYLAQNHKRVLFISTEALQSFRCFLTDKEELPKEAYIYLKENSAFTYEKIKKYFRKEIFDYLPPFSTVLESINLPFSIYKNLIISASTSEEYEFIIIDTQTGYSDNLVDILQISDHVIVPFLQDSLSKEKNIFLLESIKYRTGEKYIFMCNQLDRKQPNSLEELKNIKMSVYIEYDNDKKGKKLTKLQELQRLGYMFL